MPLIAAGTSGTSAASAIRAAPPRGRAVNFLRSPFSRLVPSGNMATIFTQSGRAGREFRERVEAGMAGINVPIAQPFAFFPFSGWKGSFFGDLHVHGMDGVEFYTRKKVVVTRW